MKKVHNILVPGPPPPPSSLVLGSEMLYCRPQRTPPLPRSLSPPLPVVLVVPSLVFLFLSYKPLPLLVLLVFVPPWEVSWALTVQG